MIMQDTKVFLVDLRLGQIQKTKKFTALESFLLSREFVVVLGVVVCKLYDIRKGRPINITTAPVVAGIYAAFLLTFGIFTQTPP